MAGRLTVNPGDRIISTWGNQTYDQTVQQYASVADRNAQWPAPLDGAMAYTTDTATLWVRRAGVWKALPLGYVTSAAGPASQVDAGATFVTLVTVTFAATAGRRYRISAYCNGSQQTATGVATRYQVQDDQSGAQNVMYLTNMAVGYVVVGSTNYLYTPTTTKTATINLAAAASAGVLRSTANSCNLLVEDIGF